MAGHNITADSTKRQVELNQWEYSYKINTLFMMQFIFMCLYKYGFFKLPFIVFVYIIIIIIIIFVAVIRDRGFNHDDRYWTKMNFPMDGKIVSNILPDVVANIATQQQEAQCGPTGSRGPTGSVGPTGSEGPIGIVHTGGTGPRPSDNYMSWWGL